MFGQATERGTLLEPLERCQPSRLGPDGADHTRRWVAFHPCFHGGHKPPQARQRWRTSTHALRGGRHLSCVDSDPTGIAAAQPLGSVRGSVAGGRVRSNRRRSRPSSELSVRLRRAGVLPGESRSRVVAAKQPASNETSTSSRDPPESYGPRRIATDQRPPVLVGVFVGPFVDDEHPNEQAATTPDVTSTNVRPARGSCARSGRAPRPRPASLGLWLQQPP